MEKLLNKGRSKSLALLVAMCPPSTYLRQSGTIITRHSSLLITTRKIAVFFSIPWYHRIQQMMLLVGTATLPSTCTISELLDGYPHSSLWSLSQLSFFAYHSQVCRTIITVLPLVLIPTMYTNTSLAIWVKWWAASNILDPNGKLGYYLGIYAVLGACALISLVISCWELIINMVPKSGENFHWILLQTVLKAPMSFFSITDTGVTVNRFSQDLMLIDMELPVAALNTFATFVLCIAQMILIGVASIYAAIAFPIILGALYFIQRWYLRTSRQLRLLDLEAKSPLYSQFIEILSGLATVRAFGWQNALEEKNRQLLDDSQKPFYLLFAVQRWLTLVLDLIVTATAVMLIILVVQLRGTSEILSLNSRRKILIIIERHCWPWICGCGVIKRYPIQPKY
jgi:ABC-type multidrug transport system fused ATPase/permease subunit